MNSHLSSEQLDQLLSGQPTPAVAEHLAHCERCTAEVATFSATLSNIRTAAIHTAEHHRRYAVVPTAAPRRLGIWATAAAAVVFVAGAGPFLITRHPANVPAPHQAPVNMAATTQQSDEALLESIQNDLSSTVPQSLEPLAGTSSNSANSTSPNQRN